MDKELMNGVPEEEKTVEDISEDAAAENAKAEEATEDAEEVAETAEESEEQESDNEVEPDEDSLCIICGKNAKGEDSDYCPECEASFYKTKVPFLAWISGVAAIGVGLLAFVLSLLLSAPALQAARADVYAMQNRWYAAYLEYSNVSTVVDEINSIIGTETPLIKAGKGVAEKTVISYAKSRSPLDAAYMAMMIYGENVAEQLPGVKEYTDIYDEFYNNYTVMSEPLDAMLVGATQEETFNALNAFADSAEVNKVYLNYFLFNAADFYQFSVDERLEYIKAADAAAQEQGRDFSWLYYLEISDILAQHGRYDEALEFLRVLADKDKTNYRVHDLMMRCTLAKGDNDGASKILAEFKINNEGFDSAYSMEATYHRCLGDFEKSKLIIEEGLVENDFSSELHRQLALLYLIEGKYSEAFEEVFAADSNASYMANYYMDSSGYTPQLDNTMYLCINICKKHNLTSSENAVYIDQIFDYYKDFVPSVQVSKVISGEITARDAIMEGAYDLA